MSGIAALIHFDGRDAARPAIEAMTAAMDFRGRDGMQHRIEGGAALGHCTTHTNPGSRESQQPLASEQSGAVVTMDGYLANREELRRELHTTGARLRDRSDAELVLRAFEAWGDGLVDHLDGEYAIVIWDAQQRRALCITDHIGLRPLHFAWDGRTLVVASDPKAVIAALRGQVTLNTGYLAELVSAVWLSNRETIYKEVQRLEPAHLMVVDAGGIGTDREYWTISFDRRLHHARDEDWVEEYRTVFAECVRRAGHSDQPVACDVSGGLDSSAVFAMARYLLDEGRLAAPDVRGYTMLAPAGSEADEIEYARAVGDHVGSKVTEVPMHLPSLDWFLAAQRRDGNIAPYPNCAMLDGQYRAMAADGCRVALNGLGGDHWLGGTGRYYFDQLRHGELRALGRSLAADLRENGLFSATTRLSRESLAAMLPNRAKQRLKAVAGRLKIDDPYGMAAEPNPWLRPELRQEFDRRQAAAILALPDDGVQASRIVALRDPFDRLAQYQQNCLLARAGMEPRYPMFSRRFVEFAIATPEHLRYRGNLDRYLHRITFADLLPKKVAFRRSEAAFDLAITGQLAEIGQQLRRETPAAASLLFAPENIADLVASCCNATNADVRRWQLWSSFICLRFLEISRPWNPRT